MEEAIDQFNSFTDKPVKFLGVQSEVKDDVKNLIKSLYDYTKKSEKIEKNAKKSALTELIVQDVDEEQIWQQIELQNTECWDRLVWEVANCMSIKNDLVFPVHVTEEDQKEAEVVEDEDSDPGSEEKESDQNDVEEKIEDVQPKKKKILKVKLNEKKSIVDDDFFKLHDMEKFLLKEEKNDGKPAVVDSDEESIDMFEDEDQDDDEEEDGKDVMYSDFFDQNDQDEEYNDNDEYNGHNEEINENNDQENDFEDVDEEDLEELHNDEMKKKKVRFEQPSSSDDEESANESPETNISQTNEKKSEFEQRQERLRKQIDRLEAKNLNEASWQLKGEVDASKRPQNSLLQEVVDFDLTSRPPPIITEETTLTLEEIIKQRIKDKAWDDVARKEKPVDDQLLFRKKEILDHSKSKLSLAQVYEAEYLKQKQALSGDVEEEKEPEAHTEVRNAMANLFSKLDALCHYHYTPKAPQAEVKIVTNTPAISMEEVAPVATSDAALLAPEEVKKKTKGDLISKDERTQTDKNRERRKKKKFQRAKGKVEKVTEHRNTVKGTEANDKSLKTSKAFFQQLNDDSTSLIKANKNKRNNKNKGQ